MVIEEAHSLQYEEYILGADIGTTGCKTVILDTGGKIIGSESEYYQTSRPKPDWAEQNPEDWYRTFKKTVKHVLIKNGINGNEIVSVGIDGMMNSPTFINRFGKLLRSSIIWMDQRSIPQARSIKEKIYEERSQPVSAVPMLTKILWVKENQPKIWNRTYKVLSPKDYVRFRLTGSLVSDVSDASATSLFDAKKLNWSSEICEALDIDVNKLPEVVPSVKIVGHISPKASKETGIAEGTPVVAGCSDGAADCLTAGVAEPPDCLIRLGTTGALFMVIDRFTPDPSLRYFVVGHCISNRWLAHQIFPFGLPHSWFHYTFYEQEMRNASKKGEDPYSAIEERAERISPGSDGLIFHPYLMSDASTHMRGGFFGIALQHKREHFARAVLEGIAFSLKESFAPFFEINPSIKSVKLIGGGSKSRLVRQIVCNVLGVRGLVPLFQDASLGAAMLGGIGSNVFRDHREAVERCVKIRDITRPSSAIQRKYGRLFAAFAKLYQDMAKNYELLSNILEK